MIKKRYIILAISIAALLLIVAASFAVWKSEKKVLNNTLSVARMVNVSENGPMQETALEYELPSMLSPPTFDFNPATLEQAMNMKDENVHVSYYFVRNTGTTVQEGHYSVDISTANRQIYGIIFFKGSGTNVPLYSGPLYELDVKFKLESGESHSLILFIFTREIIEDGGAFTFLANCETGNWSGIH